MLRIKIIKGLNPGAVFDLKDGENIVGRTPDCHVVLAAPGVSKRHAKINVSADKCVITDLGSSNGTFVNGIKIRDRILRPGDRIGFHDIIVELVSQSLVSRQSQPMTQGTSALQTFGGQVPAVQNQTNALATQNMNMLSAPNMVSSAEIVPADQPKTLTAVAKTYVEEIVLPGVYKITEVYPMKNVVGTFLLIFIILVTFLASIPMAEMTKQGVQKEAQRRAYTIARQLATYSEKAIAAGTDSNIRTDFAESEDGVTMALVVAREDGHIIAPLAKSQSYSTDEFVARARKKDEVYIDQISATIIGVSVPIQTFSSEMGRQVITSYAVIKYKMDTFDLSATVGLFARVLIIAMILGAIVYFVMYRTLINPISKASSQLDQVLRGEKDVIDSPYDFDVFKKFIENINSTISRMSQSQNGQSSQNNQADRITEASNLVRIVSDASFALDPKGVFLQVNAAFEELTGMRLLTLQGQPLETLQDQALKLQIEDLCGKSKELPGTITTGQLEISGANYEIDVQASPEGNQVAYYFGTIKKGGGG